MVITFGCAVHGNSKQEIDFFTVSVPNTVYRAIPRYIFVSITTENTHGFLLGGEGVGCIVKRGIRSREGAAKRNAIAA